MPRKLALKRLTASDLTLFKWHFQNHPAGKQKAFNLDASVLVDELYPQLGEPALVPQPRYPHGSQCGGVVTVWIFQSIGKSKRVSYLGHPGYPA